MSENRFDAVVIGAGPAGASAAHFLAKKGARVALLDRNVSHEKTCGGFCSPRAAMMLERMGIALPAAYIQPIRLLDFASPDNERLEVAILRDALSSENFCVSRQILDKALVNRAVQSGAKLHDGTAADGIEQDEAGVTVRCGASRIRADFAICCNGAARTRLLPGKAPALPIERGFAIRAYFENVSLSRPDAALFFYCRELLPYYGWIFPLTENRANVGIMLPEDRILVRTASPGREFERFVNHPSVRPELEGARTSGKPRGGHLFMALNAEDAVRGRALLAGEAAGFVNSLTGEGIGYALESGQLAAEEILGALSDGRANLQPYADRCNESFGRELQSAREMRDRTASSEALERLFRYGKQSSEKAIQVSNLLMGGAGAAEVSHIEWEVASYALASCVRAEDIEILNLLNTSLLITLKNLPVSLHNSAFVHFSKYAVNPSDPLDFFSYFPVPAWSILRWLNAELKGAPLSERELESAAAGHGMALLLHALDNHLVDGQNRTTHLLLQIRTQAWLRFTRAVEELAGAADATDGADDAHHRGPAAKFVRGAIDDYFANVNNPPAVNTLDEYLELTRKQGATWNIVPLLVARGIGGTRGEEAREIEEAIKGALESFVLAFRILDDIRDLPEDALAGKNTAVRLALAPEGRALWDACRETAPAGAKRRNEPGARRRLRDYIKDNRVLPRLGRRICAELETGVENARRAGLNGYAAQLLDAGRPIQELIAAGG